jgi:hypothetical protein
MKSNSLMAVLVGFALTSPVVYGATTGFEASEGWVIGQPPPAGSGCTLELGSGAAPGVCAVSGGQALALPCRSKASFDISNLPMTGVQHVTVDLSFTGPNYLSSFYETWAGLSFGSMQVINNSIAGSGISILFDAARANTVPTNKMNDGDLIMKVYFLGSAVASIPFASPATYRFDFAIDYTKNTTTFTLFRDGGATPVATNTWSGTFDANLATVLSGSWYAPEGTTTYVDNLFVGTAPEPVPYTYTTNNGAITITGYTGTNGAATIPSLIEGLSVTSIGSNAFWECTSLTSIIIPDSVTSIGSGAFQYCYGLTNILIGSGTASIGSSAFFRCGLSRIIIPNCVTNIGDQAFKNCTSLTNVTIGSGVGRIEDGAFYGCTNLTGVILGSHVTSIGNSAFQSCSSLTSVTIPTSVVRIGDSVFRYCASLISITIPDSISNVGDSAFEFCTSLTNATIPNSITNIGYHAFESCFSLASVIIPDSVSSIGGYAFYRCTNLTAVTIGNSVAAVWEQAFSGCTSLMSLYFKGNAPLDVGYYVFAGDDTATVYRLSGATGWPPVPDFWSGLPTALWQPDSDTDGIPDSWALQYFGGITNAIPNAICSNGINTVREAYLAGLNPNNKDARFGITEHKPGINGTLGWNAVSGRVYSVYWTTNLMTGFQCLESNIPWTRGSFTNSAAVPCGYYKIDVRLE